MSLDWPLRGRDDELTVVRQAMSARKIAGVILIGPIGAGRTRLLRHLASAGSSSGMEVLSTRGSRSAATIPLGAMTELLPPLGGSARDTAQLLHLAVRHQMERGKGRRVVLTVDDAHLLDDTSATLVYQLAVSGLAFVIAAVPSGSRVPDPIFALWKDRLIERLDVNPLDHGQTEELLVEVLDGAVDGGTLHQLWQLSLGHPLFLRELVEGGLESGDLARHDGI
jgi:replication-associated recombination protein RarA